MSTLDIRDIMDMLPHRYPFLLIDRIVELDTEAGRVVALKNVTANEPQFTGHFPGVPVMPGVLIIEAMAQACAIIALIFGRQKRHAAIAGAIGLLLCVPAMLTAFVNLTDAEGMTLFGLIRIPRLEGFEKTYMAENLSVIDKLWTVLVGGVFQVLRHENIHQAMYTPDGMLALFVFSLPLMALGALALFARWTDGYRGRRRQRARWLRRRAR